jgi:uncharacterized protein (DUF58 family)
VAGAVLVMGAVIYVRSTHFRVSASRQVRPGRVHAGGASRVELTVRNLANRTPLLTARDPFDGGRRWARFRIAPLSKGESGRAAYRLPTDQRGVFPLGPLSLSLSDPFRLASTSTTAAPATTLTVYPRIDDVFPMPHAQGADATASAVHPTALSPSGDDFYALREYQTGDDLRRVHWPSTARLEDDLMVRQDELPWQGRGTILVDLRKVAHTPESFELAVSAAASVAYATYRAGSLVRLLATDGRDSGFSTGRGHIEAVLEYLAGVSPGNDAFLPGVIAGLRRSGNGGGLAVITTARASNDDLRGVAQLRGRFGSIVVVLFQRSAWDDSSAGRRAPVRETPPIGRIVQVTADDPFAPAWDRTVAPLAGVPR